MKKRYKIIRTITSRSTNNLFQSQKMKLNNFKSELQSNKAHSLLEEMYSAENENIFI